MLQKVFRMFGIFCFLGLVLSPMYSKYILHYITSVDILHLDLNNITPQSNHTYVCKQTSNIKIPSERGAIQIIHFTSPICESCINELHMWSVLPYDIYKNLYKKEVNKVEVIHVINSKFLQNQSSENFINAILTNNKNDVLYKDILNAGVSVCVASIDNSTMSKMSIDTFPSSIISQNGKILYSVSGSITNNEMNNILGIIEKNL